MPQDHLEKISENHHHPKAPRKDGKEDQGKADYGEPIDTAQTIQELKSY